MPLPDASKFDDHMRTHVDGDRFKCNICEKKVVFARTLKVNSGLLMYDSLNDSHTHTSFRQQMHLKEHSKMPKNKPCNICDKLMPNYSEQIEHMKTHMDGNDYKCQFCDYRSTKHKYLKVFPLLTGRLSVNRFNRYNTSFNFAETSPAPLR